MNYEKVQGDQICGLWSCANMTAYQRFKHRMVKPVAEFAREMSQDLYDTDWSDLLWFMFVILFVASLIYLASAVLKPWLKRLILRIRGYDVIYCESMQPGSIFNPLITMPNCQVEIRKPGMLLDTFVGYGVRYKNVLITPLHVATQALDNGVVMLRHGNQSQLVRTELRPSQICSDLVYMHVSDAVWASLGVSSARMMKLMQTGLSVTVCGSKGSSIGVATPSYDLKHILQFTGSTVAGYSGAAYTHNGSVYGIHVGSSTNYNIGICFHSIVYEIVNKLGLVATPEASLSAASSYDNLFTKKKKNQRRNWRPEEQDEEYDQTFDEAKQEERLAFLKKRGVQTEAMSELADGLSEWSVGDLERIATLARTLAESKKNLPTCSYLQQGDTSFADVLTGVPTVDPLEARVTDLERRVSLLEKVPVVKTKNTPQVKNPYPCSKCERSYKTKIGLAAHEVSKHEEEAVVKVKTEAATLENPVQVNTFLDQRPKTRPLRKKNKNTSSSTSTTKAQTTESTVSQEPPLKMESLTQQLKMLCDSFQQGISGLREDLQRFSEV